jgi:thiopeptide-type bacteriocin biosynthesis protein
MDNIRTFIPGSEWLYFKIYTGTKTADLILKQNLYPLAIKLLNTGIIDKWFFIRYSDPDFHIRFRLHLTNTRDFNSIFERFHETVRSYVDNDLVWNIQCDTYQRELERYGINTIDLVEYIFFVDSNSVIHLLENLNSENADEHRWNIALMLIDSFLSVFSFDISQRKELITKMAEGYKTEFGMKHHTVKKQLDTKYRSKRTEIQNIMTLENLSDPVFDIYCAIIKKRQQAIFPVAQELIRMERENKLQISLDSLLTGMMHMTMNRWFRSKNRLYELVVYDFMSRYYTSYVAKNTHS